MERWDRMMSQFKGHFHNQNSDTRESKEPQNEIKLTRNARMLAFWHAQCDV